MRASMIGLSAVALIASAAPALAQDDTKDFTLTGSAAIVSDYRFRGLSQSNKRFAVQASATLAHSSGAYISFWSSSIDDYVAANADAELDLIAGYSKTISGFTLDGGVLYYVYPSAIKGVNTDFFEPYASIKYTVGPATLKGGVAYAPKQKAVASLVTGNTKDDNLYLYGEASGAIPDTGFALSSHVGYSKGPSYLTGLRNKSYWDWNVGATYTWRNATFGVSYVDTNANSSDFNTGFKDVAKAGVVGSVTYAF